MGLIQKKDFFTVAVHVAVDGFDVVLLDEMDVFDIEGGEEMLATLPEGGGGGDQAQVELPLCHHAVT